MAEHNYLVRVVCKTFNQASYIEDAMNGFSIQKTDFPFICIIIDDASTDNEPEVIQRYLAGQFDILDTNIAKTEETADYKMSFARHKTNLNCFFAVFFLKYNHFKKKDKRPYYKEWTKDVKYEALCEGDDFWTDPLKLQKQIDHMESHPDCTLCFTNALMHWEDGSGQPDRLFAPNLETRDYPSPELSAGWITPTASFVFRKEVLETALYHYVSTHPKLSIVGDVPLVLTCSKLGTVHALADVTCVYRRQPNGFMLSTDSSRRIARGDYRYYIYKVFGKEHLDSSVFMSVMHYRAGIPLAVKEKNYKNLFRLLARILCIYVAHPISASKRLAVVFQERKLQRSS